MVVKCGYCKKEINEKEETEVITKKIEETVDNVKIILIGVEIIDDLSHEHYCSRTCLFRQLFKEYLIDSHILNLTLPTKEIIDKQLLLEQLADLEHQQWAHWMKYLFGRCASLKENPLDKTEILLSFKKDTIDRWRRQMGTKYSDLSEQEKDSDRKWARQVLELVKKVSI